MVSNNSEIMRGERRGGRGFGPEIDAFIFGLGDR